MEIIAGDKEPEFSPQPRPHLPMQSQIALIFMAVMVMFVIYIKNRTLRLQTIFQNTVEGIITGLGLPIRKQIVESGRSGEICLGGELKMAPNLLLKSQGLCRL